MQQGWEHVVSNTVYIAASLDGYITDRDGSLDWLHNIPNPDNSDFGFSEFVARMDALVMGRVTFETVCGFEGAWPYSKPVFVLSNTLDSVPTRLDDKAEVVRGPLQNVLAGALVQSHYRRKP